MAQAQTHEELAYDPFPSSAPPPPDFGRLVGDCFGATRGGTTRASNEDRFVVATLERALCVRQSSARDAVPRHADTDGLVLLVAEGPRLRAARGSARGIDADVIDRLLHDGVDWVFGLDVAGRVDETHVLGDLQTALRGDERVLDSVRVRAISRNLGAAITLAYCHGSSLYLAHEGGGRGYLLRDDILVPLTRERAFERELYDDGDAEPTTLRRPLVHQAIGAGGGSPGLAVEVHRVQLEPHDIVMLCSDGLTDALSDAEIAQALETAASPRAACEQLIEAAAARDGTEDVTAIVSRFEHDDATVVH
jgi:hypothetical protein